MLNYCYLRAMKIDKKKLNKLRKQMNGYMNQVAREMPLRDGKPVAPSTVYRVLGGVWEDGEVIAKCIEVRDREMKKKQRIENKI